MMSFALRTSAYAIGAVGCQWGVNSVLQRRALCHTDTKHIYSNLKGYLQEMERLDGVSALMSW